MTAKNDSRRRTRRATQPRAGTELVLRAVWTLGPKMAQGGFGEIFEASSSSGQTGVVKLIPKDPGAQRELLFELPAAPNVLPAIDRGEWGDYWVLVMPRAEGSLRQHLQAKWGSLPEAEVLPILRDIVSGLAAMSGEVVHRDLKPENILLWEGRWCIADFGIARYAEATTAPDTRKGAWTPAYAAPEQWRFERATAATDIYALGVIAFELLEGRLPYPGPIAEEFREQHLHGKPPEAKRADHPLRALLLECLFKEPEGRPTAANVLERLRQPAEPKSPGLARLQEAYGQHLVRSLEEQGQRAQQEAEEARRHGLLAAAESTFGALVTKVEGTVKAIAPLARTDSRGGLAVELGQAGLVLEPLRRSGRRALTQSQLGFEVIAFSAISIRYKQQRGSWQGRSHSIWYCNALDRAAYRLVELAFMAIWTNEIKSVEPFALEPDEDAFLALSPTAHVYQSAWNFTPIDQGNEDEFIDRWLGWLGDASRGNLQRPSSLPERR